MADNRSSDSSLGEKTSDSGMTPETQSERVQQINPANDQRAVDYGESGQYAPGGLYGQLEENAPRRIDLDEQVDSALKNEGS